MKQKFPRTAAVQVAKELCVALAPRCERLIVAGSLRRRKSEVGDVEIVFIPKVRIEPDPADLFRNIRVCEADRMLDQLLATGVLEKRLNTLGRPAWGKENKLARHVPTGIPVDLFATTERSWFNYLVCRTGPAESNTRIASAAQALGWKWHPTGPGFERLSTNGWHIVASERDVFEFVGLPFLESWQR